MRIYHICNMQDSTNGIFFVLMTLATEQRKLGNDVHVFNLTNSGACNDTIKYADIKALKTLFCESKPDIVIFHGVFYLGIYPLTRTLRKQHIPYLIELHGALSKQNMRKSRLKKTVARLLFLNRVIRQAAGVVYLNRAEEEFSAIKKQNSNGIIIPNGCYPLREKEEPRYHSSKMEVLFLGRIDVTHKGLDFLIEALKALEQEGAAEWLHVSFYGAGESKDVEWLKNELEGISGIADFYGPVYGEDKTRVYLNSDIFILTSRYEGFPMAILEALSAGCPCIVTRATNVSDILEENHCGWVCGTDSRSIIETIKEAKEEIKKDKKSLIEKSRQAAKKYNWQAIARESIKQYEKIIRDC